MGCGQSRQDMDTQGEATYATLDVNLPSSLAHVSVGGEYTVVSPAYKGYIVRDVAHGAKILIYPDDFSLWGRGDRLRIEGEGECVGGFAPFSFSRTLFARNTIATIRRAHIVSAQRAGPAPSTQPFRIFSSEFQGIPEGLLLGDVSTMSDETYSLFVESGLVYLVAASGGNIQLLVGLLIWIVSWGSRRIKNISGILCVMVYTFFLYENIALRRAALAYNVRMIYLGAGRRVDAWRVLLVSLVIMACGNPWILTSSRGLLLSVSGVLGVRSMLALKLPSWQQYLALPVYAFLGTVGPLLYLLGSAQLITIFLSLPAQILAESIVVISLFMLVPYIGGELHALLLFFVRVFIGCAQWGASHGVRIVVQGYGAGAIWAMTRLVLLGSSHLIRLHYIRTK